MPTAIKIDYKVVNEYLSSLINGLRTIVKNNYNAFAALTTLACGDDNGDGFWESKKALSIYKYCTANCYNNFARINNYCSALEALGVAAKTAAFNNKDQSYYDKLDDTTVPAIVNIAKNCRDYAAVIEKWAGNQSPTVVKPI